MKNLKFYIILCIIPFAWSNSHAQEFTNYNSRNGLPSNHVYTISQDTEGFVWFLTAKGMVKYNGSDFKTFTTADGLPNNHIWDVRTTSDHKIWYLTKSNSLGYILKDSVYRFFNSKKKMMNPIFTNQVGTKIYPTGAKETYQLYNKEWILVPKQYKKKSVNTIFVQHPIVSYFDIKNTLKDQKKTSSYRLQAYNKKHEIIIDVKLTKPLRNTSCRTQLNDSLYAITSPKDYLIINLNTCNYIYYNFKESLGISELKHARIKNINGSIQLSGKGVVALLDKELMPSNPYFFPKKIKAHFGMIDKNNTLWLATFSQGVYKIPFNNKRIKYQLNNEKTGALHVLKNKIIANIQGKGFYKFDTITTLFKPFIYDDSFLFSAMYIPQINREYYISKKKIRTTKPPNNTPHFIHPKTGIIADMVQTLVYHKEKLYSTYAFGVHKIDPISFDILNEYPMPGCYDLIHVNKQLFIASSTGLKTLENEQLIPVPFASVLEHKTLVSFTKLSATSFLIHTDGFGSYFCDGNHISLLEKSGVLSVKNAAFSKDTVWLASNKGILCYHYNKNKFTYLNSITECDGLPSNNSNDIVVYKNQLLVSTENGIAIIPKNIQSSTGLEALYFDNIRYNQQEIQGSASKHLYQKNSDFTFKIGSINFLKTTPNFEYSYRLYPLQKDWTTSKTALINFNDLKHGNYTLYIKSGAFTQQQSFQILPLWYQIFWVKLIFGFTLFTLLGGLIYMIRRTELEKKIKKINEQKQLAEFELYALRSQMNPHFVFNSLNAIQYYITKNDIELSEKYLVKFAQLIRMFFDFSSLKSITIQQEILLLERYLEIEKMRFGDDFYYKIILDPTLDTETKLPTMLLQPIVENAVNHGIFHNNRKGLVTISVSYISDNSFEISISDNGVGIKKVKEIQQKSLKKNRSTSSHVLQERIRLINKSKHWHIHYQIIDLTSPTTTGTKVVLLFKKTNS